MFRKFVNSVKNWWVLLIIGIISLVCGIIVLCTPFGEIAAFSVISILFMIELIVAGIVGIAFIISNRANIPAWGLYLVLPILLVIFGVMSLGTFGRSQVFMVCFFAAGVLLKGIENIAYAISLSGVKGSGWGWTLAGGIILVLLSGFLFANPLFDMVFIGFMIAFAMIFIGIEAIVLSIQLAKLKGAIKAKVEEIEKENKE